MGKAEVGSLKHLSNKMKAKGLQRLRWYCQVCEKQCRDANGFKLHCQSESHVRQMLIVGEDPKKVVNDFSNMFQKDFLNQLKTSHGEKKIHINQFYQEYIANKEHIHMSATKWPSLTEFAKYLGRESLCRVEENEKGIHISYIDNSPDALRRQDALRKKQLQDKGDEEREQRMIREQIRRAKQESGTKEDDEEESDDADKELKRQEGDKIKLSFGAKPSSKPEESEVGDPNTDDKTVAATEGLKNETAKMQDNEPGEAPATKPTSATPMSLKLITKPQTKNVFAQAKKNALAGGSKRGPVFEQPKKMSEAERIMKEEMEKKRSKAGLGFNFPNKRQKT